MGKQIKGKPTVLQMDILDLWVRGLSTKEICGKLDCSDETVRLVKKNEELKKIYYDRQREQVIELIPLAIKRLKNILNDDEVQPNAQIAAVREVFERSHLSELTDSTDSEIKITVSYE